MPSLGKERKPASLPAPNSDFYELVKMLPAEELATVTSLMTCSTTLLMIAGGIRLMIRLAREC